jgi:hypothetical protein
MGAWGPAIFSDDTACDIRADYRELLEDGVDDAEATQRVIAEYQHLGDDEAHVLWLALAAAQSDLGRLDESVKFKALQVVDQDIGLELWEEAGPKELVRRKAVLEKLRGQLTGPQKAPTKVRKPWAHVSDLVAGDVLAYRRPSGEYVLFRVARLDEHRFGTAPILRQLDWNKSSLPSERRLRRLKSLSETRPGSGVPSVSYRVARHKKKDPDWRDIGFSPVGRVDVAEDDTAFAPRSYTDWRGVSRSLDSGW